MADDEQSQFDGLPTLGSTVSATPGDGTTEANNTVQGPHLNPIHLWAGGIKAPARYLDPDARLPDPAGGDQPFGQAGWHVCLEFKDFAHLGDLLGGGQFELPSFVCRNSLSKCGPIEENQIARLAIVAHGGPGGIDINGTVGRDLASAATDSTLLNLGTLSRYSKQFDQILKVLAFRAKVFFMSCQTGAGHDGEEFLKAVSNLWATKEVIVIGYKSVLYTNAAAMHPGWRGSTECFPGVRETQYSNTTHGNDVRYYETTAAWNDLALLPWASESTLHATQAFRGVLLKVGQEGVSPWSPP